MRPYATKADCHFVMVSRIGIRKMNSRRGSMRHRECQQNSADESVLAVAPHIFSAVEDINIMLTYNMLTLRLQRLDLSWTGKKIAVDDRPSMPGYVAITLLPHYSYSHSSLLSLVGAFDPHAIKHFKM